MQNIKKQMIYFSLLKLSLHHMLYQNGLKIKTKKYQNLLVYLFLLSSYNLRPSLLLARLVRNLSFFQTWEVCWNNDTGSCFFLLLVGVGSLKVYAAVSGLLFTYWEVWDTLELLGITFDPALARAAPPNLGLS